MRFHSAPDEFSATAAGVTQIDLAFTANGAGDNVVVVFNETGTFTAPSGTPLVGHLIAHRVDTLLITGCSTSACVRATATDAKSLNLQPIIIREAVQDRSEIAHEWTLFDIQARFADVVGIDEALAYLREQAI